MSRLSAMTIYRKLQITLVVMAATAITALAGQELQTAKVTSIKKHAQGRIVSWSNHAPIFDGYPFYDMKVSWKGKGYVVRYESLTGYYPKAWEAGKEIPVKRERGQFILYQGDEGVPAREVNPNDCVQTSSPGPPSVMPQVPCD
jgi:hypothetical protein